jgi:assimilatory nitrate reductase catalytic subunit
LRRRLRHSGDAGRAGGAAISGDPEHPANFGRLLEGSALGETLGLTNRLLSSDDPLRQGEHGAVAWSDALTMSSRTASSTSRATAGAVAFYLSGQLLTEDYYVANKLMKGFIGSANVDTNSRLCMASSVGHRGRSARTWCPAATKTWTRRT